MLALYPSNKLEHLSFLLTALLKQQPGQVFNADTILVESPGMQHWLSMSLARQRGVAMNVSYPLPVRFMWDTARLILGDDAIPAQSPYRREVLTWRIDALLQEPAFIDDPDAAPVKAYWASRQSTTEQGVQRLQLATALADVFEQYLLYRPDWLQEWEAGNAQQTPFDMERWQSKMWRMLVRREPDHPASLHHRAVTALQDGVGVERLPDRIVVFAINNMAPQLISFIDALSVHTDVHLFHLNPSVNYWGDAQSDRSRAKALREQGIESWLEQEQGNPFLGNLGQQGRDFFNLLTALDTFEVSAFDVPEPATDQQSVSLLSHLQADILAARAPSPLTVTKDDTSIEVVSTHNGLREVQLLHDNLLAWLNAEPTRRPSDIVVMCPAIEKYAPLIDAVFHRVGTASPVTAVPPRIPCSIADRSPLDAQPMVAAFISLLSLPDSRFGVVEILDYLRLDAMQRRFSLSPEDVELMTFWLEQAHVHWGLDGEHKRRISDGATAHETFSWWWGLRRLLIGMVCRDEAVIDQGLLTVPHVEGQNTLILGKLIWVIDTLSHHAAQLAVAKTPEQWHDYLISLQQACFAPDPEQTDTWESLSNATAQLHAHCDEAGYQSTLSLAQVRDVLLRQFSSPDAGNHFMTGQVTFCSMLPMRSIPFRKVCVLGLNDGEFPRQSVPMSIDLMAQSGHRLGDRSRRLEDRYLFLEALISARESLYLSYQGNSDKDNSERQPSLVLREFLHTLSEHYQVPIDTLRTNAALHPFSQASFTAANASFEQGWFRLFQAISQNRQAQQTPSLPVVDPEVDDVMLVEQAARWLEHPLKVFANRVLGIYLEQAEMALENTEPFSEPKLTRYQLLEALSEHTTSESDKQALLERARLSGNLPLTPLTDQLLDDWQAAADDLKQAVGMHNAQPLELSWQGKQLTFTTSVFEGTDAFVLSHVGAQNTRRQLGQYLTALCLAVNDHERPLHCYYARWSKGQHEIRQAVWHRFTRDEAQRILQALEALVLSCMRSPTAAFTSLVVKLAKAAGDASLTDAAATTPVQNAFNDWLLAESPFAGSMDSDTYLRWFFPEGLTLHDVPLAMLDGALRPLASAVKDKKR